MAMFARAVLPFCLSATFAACGASTDDEAGKGEPSPEPDLSSKADAFYWPTEHGLVEFGKAAPGTFGVDARFHAFDFELTGAATVGLRTDSANQKRDTVVYLYRKGASGWGRYLAKNDDDGRFLLSSLSADVDAGTYRVLVKGYSVKERGDFALTVDCAGAGCAPVAPAVADACLFGDVYRNIAANPNLTVVETQSRLTADSAFPNGEDQAFLKVVQASGWDGIDTVADAFGAADGAEFNASRVRDVFDGTVYQVIEYGAGDTSVGGILAPDGTLAAKISDGDLWPCSVDEPAGRFDDLRFTATALPEAIKSLTGFQAAKVTGLEAGKMFSQGSDAIVFAGLSALFDESCSGLPEAGEEGAPSRRGGYEVAGFFNWETQDWESALSADDVATFDGWVEGREGQLEIWTIPLLDSACGGDGAGQLALVHDRETQVVLWKMMVEWSE